MRSACGVSGSRGFTVVELLIVLVVLAIAAAVVIPSIGTAADSQAISAARVVASDLEIARSLALTTQQPHALVFRPDLKAYKVVANYGGGAYATAVAVPHPVVQGKLFEVVLAEQSGMGAVTVSSATFGGAAYVTFNSQGEPASPGVVTIRSRNVAMQVSVAILTGTVTVTRTSG